MEDCAHFESSFGAELNLWHFRTITMSKLKENIVFGGSENS